MPRESGHEQIHRARHLLGAPGAGQPDQGLRQHTAFFIRFEIGFARGTSQSRHQGARCFHGAPIRQGRRRLATHARVHIVEGGEQTGHACLARRPREEPTGGATRDETEIGPDLLDRSLSGLAERNQRAEGDLLERLVPGRAKQRNRRSCVLQESEELRQHEARREIHFPETLDRIRNELGGALRCSPRARHQGFRVGAVEVRGAEEDRPHRGFARTPAGREQCLRQHVVGLGVIANAPDDFERRRAQDRIIECGAQRPRGKRQAEGRDRTQRGEADE